MLSVPSALEQMVAVIWSAVHLLGAVVHLLGAVPLVAQGFVGRAAMAQPSHIHVVFQVFTHPAQWRGKGRGGGAWAQAELHAQVGWGRMCKCIGCMSHRGES